MFWLFGARFLLFNFDVSVQHQCGTASQVWRAVGYSIAVSNALAGHSPASQNVASLAFSPVGSWRRRRFDAMWIDALVFLPSMGLTYYFELTKRGHMKVTRLIKCMGAFGSCLLLTAHSFAFAEQPPSETVAPVEHVSFHQLVFAGGDFSILNNLYPPTGDACSKKMSFISPASSLSPVQFQGPQSTRATGERFSGYASGTRSPQAP